MALDLLTQRVYVGQECCFRVSVTLAGSPGVLKVKLKSLVNQSVVNGETSYTSEGLYEVSVTPFIRGRHELSALVNGSHVGGSPWSLFVHQRPEALGVQVKEFTCDSMSCPLDLAVNQGKVYVSCHLAQQIVVFNLAGERLTTIGGPGKLPFAPLNGPPPLFSSRRRRQHLRNDREEHDPKAESSWRSTGLDRHRRPLRRSVKNLWRRAVWRATVHL